MYVTLILHNAVRHLFLFGDDVICAAMHETFHRIHSRFQCTQHMDYLFSHRVLTQHEVDTIEKVNEELMVRTSITLTCDCERLRKHSPGL